MQNEAQYDLDRKPAKISVYTSNELDKQEYMTGEDLGQLLLNKQDLSILHWVKLLIRS